MNNNRARVKTYNTPAAKKILEIVSSAKSPLSASEIFQLYKEYNILGDRSTIYRQLDKLVGEKLISELDFLDGKKRYERQTNHHHHLICQNCRKATCIELDEMSLNRLIVQNAQKHNFRITKHTLEIFGFCQHCDFQKSANSKVGV